MQVEGYILQLAQLVWPDQGGVNHVIIYISYITLYPYLIHNFV